MITKKSVLSLSIIFILSGCATTSELIFRQKFPSYINETGSNLASINFSADKKYESEKGVPMKGEPLICRDGKTYTVLDEKGERRSISVEGDKEIAVTVIISWYNSGWQKTCWPFVAFKPEKNSKYVVVNERIGGKGLSAMWTGAANQTCGVTVYKELESGFERVNTYAPSSGICAELSSK